MATLENTTSKQFLSFILRDEHFAVAIGKIREVLDVSTLTRIPRMPEYINGVINLRGAVVPVVDLGYKLGMRPVVHTVNTCIMIVEINLGDGSDTVEMGVVTDAVQEVMNLNTGDIEPPPKLGSSLNTDFILGMGRQSEKFMIMLDIDKVLSAEGQELGDFELPDTSTDDQQEYSEESMAAC